MNTTWDIVAWINAQERPWFLLITAFFFAQLINVVLSTIRSIVLIKGSKKTAVIFNVISYTINAFVTALIAGVVTNVIFVCVITAITNLIGVWLGLTIVDKLRKDQLWRISTTVKITNYKKFIDELKDNKIKFITFETDWDKIKLVDVFSHNKEESQLLHNIFAKYDIKYTILVNNKYI